MGKESRHIAYCVRKTLQDFTRDYPTFSLNDFGCWSIRYWGWRKIKRINIYCYIGGTDA